jgi:hypothetical protein
VNNDGFDDVLVGASSNSAAGLYAGRAYVYFGGPNADSIADLTLTGEAAGDVFGTSVAGIGDVNGDDFDDFAVGAPYNDSTASGAGRVYVYWGGPILDAFVDLVLDGEEYGDYLGYSLSRAGDLNGDGINDLIVGAPSNDPIDFEVGRVYVYHGGPGLDTIPELTLTGEESGDLFSAVISGGNVNGDGFDDVIASGGYANSAEIYNGGPQIETTPMPDLILPGESPDDNLYAVSGGDLNGDGFDDVIGGAPGNDAGGEFAGRAYVFLGGPEVDTTAELTFTGEASNDLFGAAISGAGDFNADGFDDVIVGAFRNDFAGPQAGRAYVYLGGSGITGVEIPPSQVNGIMLSPPRPNPLVGSGTAQLQFELKLESPVRLFIQDIQGRTVAEREWESFGSGTHSISWNPGEFASGVYYLRIEAGGDVATTKWVMVR